MCKLKESIYGLKQALRQWNKKLKSVLIEFGFMKNLRDYSLFTYSKDNLFLVLFVYVDDIIIIGNEDQEIQVLNGYIGLLVILIM